MNGVTSARPQPVSWSVAKHGWSSKTTPSNRPVWLQVDLGAGYLLDTIRLHPRNGGGNAGMGFSVDFRILISGDGVSWNVVAGASYAVQLAELQAFGPEQPFKVQSSTDSTTGYSDLPEALVDLSRSLLTARIDGPVRFFRVHGNPPPVIKACRIDNSNFIMEMTPAPRKARNLMGLPDCPGPPQLAAEMQDASINLLAEVHAVHGKLARWKDSAWWYAPTLS